MSPTPINILFVCVKKGVRAAIAKAIVEQQSNGVVQATDPHQQFWTPS